MEDLKRRLLQRLIRSMPTRTLGTTLRGWARLSPQQQDALDLTLPKYVLTQRLLALCEVGVVLCRVVLCWVVVWCLCWVVWCGVVWCVVLCWCVVLGGVVWCCVVLCCIKHLV